MLTKKSEKEMVYQVEVERSYLLESLPKECAEWPSKIVFDKYFPPNAVHPQIRLRQSGDLYFLTKKYPKQVGNFSEMIEETIDLEKSEFDFLNASINGLELRKQRYFSDAGEAQIEIDVYMDQLEGLIVIDFEFASPQFRDGFSLPSFIEIGNEITDTRALAAGNLAGKSFQEIKAFL